MNKCKTPGCGSYAINPRAHGRQPDTDLDLCDVCYWRTRAEAQQAPAEPSQSGSAGEAAIERAIDWIRNNYQEHSIASLCDGLRAHMNGVAK